jgi:hypothetical protein
MAVKKHGAREVGPTESRVIPKGSTVFCPGCGTGLYITLEDVSVDTIRNISLFEALGEQADSRLPFECRPCNRLIISSGGTFFYKARRARSF